MPELKFSTCTDNLKVSFKCDLNFHFKWTFEFKVKVKFIYDVKLKGTFVPLTGSVKLIREELIWNK